ncbi:hypothetical protein J6590_103544 [Homalodisca vitripennis]|nr:hypothetical protein J6590_008138 [Homalodisca vitripennis]KAG8318875.1 hypothetical protein J6590_103544 [Homalodisca vitripennis]
MFRHHVLRTSLTYLGGTNSRPGKQSWRQAADGRNHGVNDEISEHPDNGNMANNSVIGTISLVKSDCEFVPKKPAARVIIPSDNSISRLRERGVERMAWGKGWAANRRLIPAKG